MKTKLFLLLMTFLASFALTVNCQVKQEHKVLYEKAKYTMETKADLKGAVDLFKSLISTYPKEREYAANSQLLIGMCYEKLGKKQASEAYKKVIEIYSDQQQTAEIAKARLQGLTSQIVAVDKNPAKPTIRQIILDRNIWKNYPYSSGPVTLFDFSPDGESFVYISDMEVSKTRNGLYIANISGPPSSRLISTSEFRRETFPHYLPDGKNIGFIGYLPGDDNSKREFYLVNSTGGKAKNISHNPLIYSPDGKYTIYPKIEAGHKNLYLIENHIGDTTALFSFPSENINSWNTDISPDSRWISYSGRKKDERSKDFDCYLVSISGDKHIRLTNSKGFDGYGAWSKKNYSFYFVSDRFGDRNIFRLKINPDTGEKMGNAEQITFYKDYDVRDPCFIDKKNALAYCISKKLHQIVIPGKDKFDDFKTIATGKNPIMSPDGNTIYFVRDKISNPGIYSIPRTGGAKKRLTKLVPCSAYFHSNYFSLSPDGSTIVFFTDKDENEKELWFLSVKDQKLFKSVTVRNFTEDIIQPDWSPDSKKVAYFLDNMGLFTVQVWEDKAEKIVGTEKWNPYSFYAKWSPDGKYIAGYVRGEDEKESIGIIIVSTQTREIKKITPREEYEWKEGLEWYPDSKKLAYMYYDPDNDDDGIREAYVDGSPTTEMINQPDVWDYVGTWDPNGIDYYFQGNPATGGWALYKYNSITKNIVFLTVIKDNFLPIFSKDGKYMVLNRMIETENQLWMMEGVE